MELLNLPHGGLAYKTEGRGAPVLLVHGAGGDHHMFDALIETLCATHQVIAYDQRGCGESDPGDAPYDLLDLARDARDLIRALGLPRAHVYGTSLGGRVAQALALCSPEMIDRLVIGNSWPLTQALSKVNPEACAQLDRLRSQVPWPAEEIALFYFPQDWLDAHPGALSLFAMPAADCSAAARRRSALLEAEHVWTGKSIAPTLCVSGGMDRLAPPALSRSLATNFAHASVHVIDGAGHLPAIQMPSEMARLLREFFAAEELGLAQPPLTALSA